MKKNCPQTVKQVVRGCGYSTPEQTVVIKATLLQVHSWPPSAISVHLPDRQTNGVLLVTGLECHLTYKKVDVGFLTEKHLKEASKAGVSDRQLMEFRLQWTSSVQW